MTETRIAQIYRLGRPLFWRRLFGDWKRSVFSDKAKETPVLFNPLRRDLSEREGEQPDPGQIPKLQIDPGERERIATLVAEVRKGQGEFLSPVELAAVMPFETQRAPGVKKAREAPSGLVEVT